MKNLTYLYNRYLRTRGLYAFLSRLKSNAQILDVGCGNDSSYNIKTHFKNFHYTGIDIGDYNQTRPILADSYIIESPERFAIGISQFKNRFDAVISSHNLEHCNEPEETLKAMLGSVKSGGSFFLSIPCEGSVRFPSRRITLNYYDDSTHKNVPPSFDWVLKTLQDEEFEVIFSTRHYRPILLRVVGMLQEPYSRYIGCNMQGTWAFYGFESIFWAVKRSPSE